MIYLCTIVIWVELTDLIKKRFSLPHCNSRKKWCFPLFSYLLNVCVNNTWLFAWAGDYAEHMLAFTHSIVQYWLTKCVIPAKNSGEQKLTATFLNRAAPFYQRGHYSLNRKRCKLCRNQTIFMCKICDVALQ